MKAIRIRQKAAAVLLSPSMTWRAPRVRDRDRVPRMFRKIRIQMIANIVAIVLGAGVYRPS